MNEKATGSNKTITVGDADLDRQLDHFYRFAGTVGSTLRVDMLLEDTLNPLLDIAKADKVLISLVKIGSMDVEIVRHRGIDRIAEKRLTPDEVASFGTDVLFTDGREALSEEAVALLGTFETPTVLVPLWAYGRPLGMLLLIREETAFEPATLKLLHTAGRQLALAIENARLFADLEMSYHHLLYTQEEIISTERMAAVGSLAATMAHEIRNPLATIFSSLSQIKKHAQITGDTATLLQIAEEEAVRLNRMVSGLLEFARPGVPRIDTVNVVDMVRQVVTEIEQTSEISLNMSIVPDAETMMLDVDPTLFKKAMHHVVGNAAAAVSPDKGDITIKIAFDVEQHQQQDVVKITVTDNGHGVTREIQNKVFEPFFSTKPSGIGLGLPTVARIINDHGGTVTFDSTYKEGTTVCLVFYRNRQPNLTSHPAQSVGV